jgi:AmiR/NasT family two-component response regulator/DNA uptake protein ComE-like DNA-binding protein
LRQDTPEARVYATWRWLAGGRFRSGIEAPMSAALVLTDANEMAGAGVGATSASLEADLKRIGVHVVGATSCENLVQDSIRLAPDIVVIAQAVPGPELFAATALLESLHPVAIAAFTEDVRVEVIERALASGIHAWIVRGYSADRLRSILQLAQVRFRREKQQREVLADLSSRLEERKLVDRAKGILMSTKGMAEDEAFRTLRDAAMQGKRRVGQVAQRLIDAARSAEAVNRAGQLRMLSQRLVKLHLLGALGIEPESVEALRRASIDRLEQNISALSELLSAATFGDLLAATLSSWNALKRALTGGAQAATLHEIDDTAERLLEAAEQLTAALEASSPMEKMQLVNLAGRQRMFAQRVAKLALLDAFPRDAHGAPTATQMQAAICAFEEALATLTRSALTTPQGRVTLRDAHDTWKILCRATQLAHLPEGRLQIAQASEELLERFDELTEGYEHDLKLLVG